MKNKLMRLASKLTAAAMVASMFASVMPASAASTLTGVKDTMSRLKAGATGVTHTLTFTASVATDWAVGETIVFGYNTASFGALSFTSAAIVGTGDISTSSIVGNNLSLLCSSADCSGAVTAVFTATNPSAGSTTISYSGTSEYAGAIKVPIVDDDQVTITANIDPTMAFDLDVSITDAESAAAYVVDFGQVDYATPETSDGANYPNIWVDLATNATGGAVVTVQSLNQAMKSTSTADQWASATGSLAANTEKYGICIPSSGGVTTTATRNSTFTAQGVYLTSCTAGATMAIGGLNASPTNILLATGPIAGGRAKIAVGMSVNSTTPAHPDYTDTLTFIATATY